MNVSKYQELDDAICAHIAAGLCHPTNSSALVEVASALIATENQPFPVAWRAIDRRMQTMSKAGRLVYERTKGGGHGQWRVVDA